MMMREHGGDLDRAMARYGGTRDGWMDLSTGINPHAYEVGDIAGHLWTDLPDKSLYDAAQEAAKAAYGAHCSCVAVAGAQQAIQQYPDLIANTLLAHNTKQAKILSPTYNEHEAQLQRGGWQVSHCHNLADLHGADCAVIVNPNNPDGKIYAPQDLLDVAKHVGMLVVDESFCDPYQEASLLPHLGDGETNIIILRSFGKFYGLAGVRLGFVFGARHVIEAMGRSAGKWAVGGPALYLGIKALQDISWRDAMVVQLTKEAAALDELVTKAGLSAIGGTALFRLYEAEDARMIQDKLARHHIWSRIFSYDKRWIRLGLPAANGWQALGEALVD